MPGIGQHHIDTLADAVHGPNHSRNSAMAVLMTPFMQDPVVALLVKVLRTCRRNLARMSCDDQKCFFDIAAQHNGESHSCRGSTYCGLVGQSPGRATCTFFLGFPFIYFTLA